MLSDHFPINARFSWDEPWPTPSATSSAARTATTTPTFRSVPEGAQATKVSIRTAERVDQVGLTLSNGTTLTHGGTGGTAPR